jgi:hypothetical protein
MIKLKLELIFILNKIDLKYLIVLNQYISYNEDRRV